MTVYIIYIYIHFSGKKKYPIYPNVIWGHRRQICRRHPGDQRRDTRWRRYCCRRELRRLSRYGSSRHIMHCGYKIRMCLTGEASRSFYILIIVTCKISTSYYQCAFYMATTTRCSKLYTLNALNVTRFCDKMKKKQ